MNKSELARQYVRKNKQGFFGDELSKKALGKKLKEHYPEVFINDEDGRRFVRFVTDAGGLNNRTTQAIPYYAETKSNRGGNKRR